MLYCAVLKSLNYSKISNCLQYRRLIPGLFLLLFVQCRSEHSETVGIGVETTDSLDLLTRRISVEPDDPETRLLRAVLFHRKQAFGAALKDADHALRIDSLREDVYLLKSMIEMDYFRSLEAIRTLRKGAEIHPSSIAIKEQLGEYQLILKQYSAAVATANDILEINPHSAKSYLILGMAAREKEDTTMAMNYYSQAVKYDADLLDAWVEMARLEMSRNPAAAAPYFESALQISPENISLLHAYAMYHQNQDSLESAKNVYQKIGEIKPDYVEAYYNHALILMDQDSFHTAIPLWNLFLEWAEQKEKGFYYRGISYEMSGQPEKAYDDYLQAREENPDLPSIDAAIKSVKAKIKE